MLKKILLLTTLPLTTWAQGLINPQMEPCGSHQLMEHIDHKSPGFMNDQNQFLQTLPASYASKMTSEEIIEIPVVFHLVANDTSIFLPDSVIENQMILLNEAFRRQNADTTNLRTEFEGFGADAKIEFTLAKTDPAGNPTTGITKSNTTIEYFGGVLPYNQFQTQEIQQWVADSLMYNFFRVTNTSLGGMDPWDPNEYLNIWVSDMRILEPQLNNFKEIAFVGLATPPGNHPNWPDSLYGNAVVNDGILLHFNAVGNNNPFPYDPAYNILNNNASGGITAVHEVGHYLGLRHIWGDGDCTMDDYVLDTPKMNASSQYNCNPTKNTCVDTINGVDLPDMIENYMDYSSDQCKNIFTHGQVAIMREVINQYRPNIINTVNEIKSNHSFRVYPNPTTGNVSLTFSEEHMGGTIHTYNSVGQLVHANKISSTNQELELPNKSGFYFLTLMFNGQRMIQKVIKL